MTLRNRLRLRVQNTRKLVQSAVDHQLLRSPMVIQYAPVFFDPLNQQSTWTLDRASVRVTHHEAPGCVEIHISEQVSNQQHQSVITVPREFYWREIELCEIEDIMVMSVLSASVQPCATPTPPTFAQIQALNNFQMSTAYGWYDQPMIHKFSKIKSFVP
jgi:hypothetical protein